MKVVVAFKLKDGYVKRMVEEYREAKEDKDLSTPLGFFAYALTGGLIDFGMDSDDVEVVAYAVPDGPHLFKEDKECRYVKVMAPEEFEKLWNAVV